MARPLRLMPLLVARAPRHDIGLMQSWFSGSRLSFVPHVVPSSACPYAKQASVRHHSIGDGGLLSKKWLKAQFLKLQSDEVMALSPLSMFPFSFSASTGKVYAVYGLLHGFGALSFLSPAKLRHKGRVALWECRVWGVSSPLNARQSDLATSRKRLTCMQGKQQQSTASSLSRNMNHTCSLFTTIYIYTNYIYIFSHLDCACTQKRLRVRFYIWFIYRAVVAVSIDLKSKPCIKRHSYDSWRGLGH